MIFKDKTIIDFYRIKDRTWCFHFEGGTNFTGITDNSGVDVFLCLLRNQVDILENKNRWGIYRGTF